MMVFGGLGVLMRSVPDVEREEEDALGLEAAQVEGWYVLNEN